MSEWSIELVLKTSRGDESLVGSNPTPTANAFGWRAAIGATKDQKNKMAELIHTFKTQEFEHRPKGLGWYLTAAIIAIIFMVYFYYVSRDFFGIITIAILTGLAMAFAAQRPKEIEVQISDKGVNIGNVYFSYSSLKRFWIADHLPSTELHFETTAYLNRYVTLLLGPQDAKEIVQILSEFLPETEPEPESMSQRIARRLRF